MTLAKQPPPVSRFLREIDPSEVAELLDVLASDPLVACPVAERVAGRGVVGSAEGRLYTHGGPERSLFSVSGAVLPLRAGEDDLRVFADLVGAAGLGARAVHGRREHVLALWPLLEPVWGPAREIRDSQVLMALWEPGFLSDPEIRTRPATSEDIEAVLEVAAAVYREELRSDPFAVARGVPFRRRVARYIARGRTWILVEDERVVFKADIASRSIHAAQIQGVWVAPDMRGRGVGRRCLAAVCADLQRVGVTPSLVVNSHNAHALRCYRAVGMRPAVDYATVLVR